MTLSMFLKTNWRQNLSLYIIIPEMVPAKPEMVLFETSPMNTRTLLSVDDGLLNGVNLYIYGLISRFSRQRDRLNAMGLSVCFSVCPFVCLSICRQNAKRDFIEN